MASIWRNLYRAYGVAKRHHCVLPVHNKLEALEPRLLLSIAPSSLASALAAITTTASTAPIFLPGELISPKDGGMSPQTLQSGPLIGMNTFRADARFAGLDGHGYSVAVLDTGIDVDHPFFGPDATGNGIDDRIIYQYDFVDNDSDASDGNSHGSNVSSIIGSQDSTFTGIAPGVNLIALKVLSDGGSGNYGDLEQALQWVVANAATYNIASVNMSLGDPNNYNTPQQLYGISDELAALAAMNVIVVSAAGNSYYTYNGQQGVSYPAADANSLAVGAVWDGNDGGPFGSTGQAIDYTTGADRIAAFSQRSASLTDIFAPGALITGANATGGTVTYRGTSQATPHIAAVAALAQQLADRDLGRRLTFDEFRGLLQSSGVTIKDGDDEDDNVINTGLSFKRVSMPALADAIEAMAPRGDIRGRVWNDVDGDTVIDAGETGIPSCTVYVDANNNGEMDAGEASAQTDASGSYALTGLPARTYQIRQAAMGGWNRLSPSSGVCSVTVTANSTAQGVNFGNQMQSPGQSAQPGSPDLLGGSDTGVSSTDDVTNLDNSAGDRLLQFRIGNTVAGAYITLFADGVAIGSATATDTAVVITTNGTLDLADGTHIFTALQTEPGKNPSAVSTTRTITVDTVAPNAPAVPDLDAASDSGFNTIDNITNWDRPRFNVAAAPYYRMYRNSTGISEVRAAGMAFDDAPLADGTYSYACTAVDAAGNESAMSAAVSVTIDTVAPDAPATPDLQSGSDTGISAVDNITSDNTPTFNLGTASYFRFYSDANRLGYGQGSTFTSAALADEAYLFSVSALDVAGNESPRSGKLNVTIDTHAWTLGDTGPGSLDRSFGDTGVVVTPSPERDEAYDVALQDDGKIITVGGIGNVSSVKGCSVQVQRFNADGTLDVSFNGDGVATFRTQDGCVAKAVALQADGKIVIAGISTQGTSPRFLVARFTGDGILDSTFNHTGWVITNIGGNTASEAYDLAIQPDGKIVIIGGVGASYYGVARYNSDGSLDAGFGSGGTALVDLTAGQDFYARNVFLQGDGKIVVSGVVSIPGQLNWALGVARLGSNGVLDPTFGIGGIALINIGNIQPTSSMGMAMQADGRILCSGRIAYTTYNEGYIVRLTPSGALDLSFGGGDGFFSTTFALYGTMYDITDVLVQPDGKILGVGHYTTTTYILMCALRLWSDGSVDTTFAKNGYYADALARDCGLDGVVLQPDGQMVAAGAVLGAWGDPDTADSAVMRLNMASSPLPSLDLPDDNDTGTSHSDNVTNLRTPTLSLTVPDGEFARIYRNGIRIGADYCGGRNFLTPVQSDGTSTYTLRIIDAAGNESATTATLSVTVDTLAPTASIDAVMPDPRTISVDDMTIRFSEGISGFDLYDLQLSRNGGSNLLTLAQSLGSSNGNVTWSLGNLAALTARSGNYTLSLSSIGSGITDAAGNPLTSGASDSWVNAAITLIAGRHVFYNNSCFDHNSLSASAWDDAAIAMDKEALLPGGTATFSNYTSYSRGINGIMVDIRNLAGAITASDFSFKVGNSNDPSIWSTAPAPQSISLRSGMGVDGSDRVTIIWADNAILKQWLQVTVLANADTGLAQDDVFYFGNAIGESGNSVSSARVDMADVINTRSDPHKTFVNPADITNTHDFNRDGKVNTADELIARSNVTLFINELRLVSVPSASGATMSMLQMTISAPAGAAIAGIGTSQAAVPDAPLTLLAPVETVDVRSAARAAFNPPAFLRPTATRLPLSALSWANRHNIAMASNYSSSRNELSALETDELVDVLSRCMAIQ